MSIFKNSHSFHSHSNEELPHHLMFHAYHFNVGSFFHMSGSIVVVVVVDQLLSCFTCVTRRVTVVGV